MDQYSTAEVEVKKTFVITGVVDTSRHKTISLDEAVRLGIINQSAGTFYNKASRKTCPITAAMNDGLIKVELTTTKKSEETRKDIGLVTISVETRTLPCFIKTAVDGKTNEKVTVSRAIKRQILDPDKGTYKNTSTGELMGLDEALDKKLIVVDFDEDDDDYYSQVDLVTKTYAIYAVVNQKKKERVMFSEAVSSGLIHPETAAYYHNINSNTYYIGEAIKKGFVKAYVVDDPSEVEINTENKFVVDKLQNVRKKIINPMKAIAALRGVTADNKTKQK